MDDQFTDERIAQKLRTVIYERLSTRRGSSDFESSLLQLMKAYAIHQGCSLYGSSFFKSDLLTFEGDE